MGTRINRIEQEFVLRSLMDRSALVSVRSGGQRFDARFVEVEENALTISPGVALDVGAAVDVTFDFQGHLHTLSGSVLEATDENLRVAATAMYRSLGRQFERVRRPEAISVTFGLSGGTVQLSFPAARVSVARPEPTPEFDQSTIQGLMDEFSRKMADQVTDSKLVMLRDKSSKTFEERIMQHTGKALWMPATEGDYPMRSPYPDGRVLTKSEIIEYDRDSGTPADLISSRLANILYERRRQGITAELFWPIFYARYFVGYVHLVQREGTIPRPVLDWIGQFVDVLCFSLERHGYFSRAADSPRPYLAEVMDLSASGLLFAHHDSALYKQLLLHSDLEVSLKVGARRMSIQSRVVRKLSDRDTVYVALRFLDVKPEDFRFLYETLYETLYGRPFDPEVLDAESGLRPEEEL